MRIYILSDQNSRAGMYGIGTYVRSLCECASYCGFPYSIVHLASEYIEPAFEEDESGVQHFFFPGIEDMKLTPIYYISLVYTLRDLTPDKEERALFHLNNHIQLEMIQALRDCFPHCVILYSIHYFNWIFSLSGSTNYLIDILTGNDTAWNARFAQCIRSDFHQEKRLFREVDQVLCLSNFAYDLVTTLSGIAPIRLSLVYNGLKDERKVYSLEDTQSIRRKYNLSASEKIVLFAGRLDELKGVSHIIKAYIELKKEYADCRLVMVGDGDFSRYLEIAKEACGKILFTGRLTKDMLYELYSIADVGVMQSFHEQCSYVGIEMMMHGLPIIGTNSTGLDEMILEGETGLKLPVIEHGNRADVDIALLKDKMLFLLQNKTLREEMSRKARHRYEIYYSDEVMAREMMSVYTNMGNILNQ